MTKPPLLAIAAWFIVGFPALGGELLPADRPIEQMVDTYLEAKWKVVHVKPASPADDATLIRRLTLDLAGRIPTPAELEAFVDSRSPEKRTELVDRLIASPGFARHEARELDAMLMAGSRGSLRDYLTRALSDKRPWDQVFREIMLADESEESRKGSSEFIRQRVKDLDRLTSDVSSVFFGVNVSCAKCHDHPKVPDWKQDHFYGMKSFFARTFERGKFLGERDSGSVKFQTTKGQERQAKLMFLTGRVVDLPVTKDTPAEAKSKGQGQGQGQGGRSRNNQPPPPPKVSVRAQLVEVALQPGERDFFARSIVNRVWNQFFGSGLVMPLDQMHSANPPSHPELLEWLARDTIDHHYDLRRLIRGLVLSQAYAHSSLSDEKASDPSLFAVAPVRPMTPIQLATSMWVATADPATLPGDLSPADLDKRVEGLEGRARTLADALARPGENYQIGVAEALLFSNNPRINELLGDEPGKLVGRMMQTKDRAEQVTLAIRTIDSRAPNDEELSILGDYLRERADRSAEGCRQLVWALLTSAEFRFNH